MSQEKPIRYAYYPVALGDVYQYAIFHLSDQASKIKMPACRTSTCCHGDCNETAIIKGLKSKKKGAVPLLCKKCMIQRAEFMQQFSMSTEASELFECTLEERYLELFGKKLVIEKNVYVSFNIMYFVDSDHESVCDEIIILDLRGRFLLEDVHPSFMVPVEYPDIVTVDREDIPKYFDTIAEKLTEEWKRKRIGMRNAAALQESKVYDAGAAVPLSNGMLMFVLVLISAVHYITFIFLCYCIIQLNSTKVLLPALHSSN